jgi:hypothetical protein
LVQTSTAASSTTACNRAGKRRGVGSMLQQLVGGLGSSSSSKEAAGHGQGMCSKGGDRRRSSVADVAAVAPDTSGRGEAGGAAGVGVADADCGTSVSMLSGRGTRWGVLRGLCFSMPLMSGE